MQSQTPNSNASTTQSSAASANNVGQCPSAATCTSQPCTTTSMIGTRQIDPDNLEDILLCLSYLKQRELFLYKMAEDPSHKAMLYFLELMMNSESPLPLTYLASKLTSRQFSPEMVRAVGENEDGLRRFLARYPSLFALNGNHVSLHDISNFSNTMMLTPTPTPTTGAAVSTAPGVALAAPQRTLVAPANSKPASATSESNGANAESTNAANGHQNTSTATSRLLSSITCSSTVANVLASIQQRNGSQLPQTLALAQDTTPASAPTPAPAPPSATAPASGTVSGTGTVSSSGSAAKRLDGDSFLLESEAVRYFAEKLVRRSERWVPIKSLAGHLSQASAEIRQIVGPQSRFRKFLLAQPRVFEVQSDRDLVALREDIRREYLAAYPELHDSAGNTPTDATGVLPLRAGSRPFGSAGGRPKSLNLCSERNSATSKWLAYSRSRRLANPTGASARFSDEHDPDPDADAASLLNALGLAECDWTADGTTARSSVLSTPLEPESRSVRDSPPVAGTPSNAVAALRDALADAVRDGAAARVRRSTVTAPASSAFSSTARQCQSTLPLSTHSSSSSSSSSEATGRRHKKTSASQPPQPQAQVQVQPQAQPQPVTMTAEEYAAVEFVRKFIDRTNKRSRQAALASDADERERAEASSSASIQQLVAALAESGNETVRKAIGWTLTELEAFLKKHASFFELAYAPSKNATSTTPTPTSGSAATPSDAAARLTTVANRRLSRNAHIIIAGGAAGREDPCVSGRTMTNRCGRISHVVKLWGIVDLGRHEHVFFDKSLFKHVDDLSKYFRVGQTVWFNAILAPKDSRAKWRATQVWNAADRLLFERSNACATPTATANASKATAATDAPDAAGAQPKVRMNYLADDIRFLADSDSEEDLIKLLDAEPAARPTRTTPRGALPPAEDGDAPANSDYRNCPLVTLADEKTLEMRSGAPPEDNLLFATNREDVSMSEYVVPMPLPQPGSLEELGPQTHSATRTAVRRRSAERDRERLLVDAACQTLSTGDILATRLCHEDSA